MPVQPPGPHLWAKLLSLPHPRLPVSTKVLLLSCNTPCTVQPLWLLSEFNLGACSVKPLCCHPSTMCFHLSRSYESSKGGAQSQNLSRRQKVSYPKGWKVCLMVLCHMLCSVRGLAFLTKYLFCRLYDQLSLEIQQTKQEAYTQNTQNRAKAKELHKVSWVWGLWLLESNVFFTNHERKMALIFIPSTENITETPRQKYTLISTKSVNGFLLCNIGIKVNKIHVRNSMLWFLPQPPHLMS